ncbi:pyrroloquinoline quinone precursor peptide PqqA [Thermomonas sp.]|uniref:pyrroloquinoline quinone precursor peptide PqqA n=1 Tax=Thermomonas sp. TaxID=1971895 RepID=UPI0035B03EB6
MVGPAAAPARRPFMKIMRPDSWRAPCAALRRGRTIRHGTSDVLVVPAGAAPPTGDPHMQWQTPTAADFRFGFEITMYIAAR